MNSLNFLGTLSRDPELKYTPTGTPICNFSACSNRRWKTEAGEEKQEATFVDMTAFGRMAETISQYFRKGQRILVMGRLKQDTWEDKATGAKRSKIGVIVEGFDFIERKGDGEATEPAPTRGKPAAKQEMATAGVNDDSDIPF